MKGRPATPTKQTPGGLPAIESGYQVHPFFMGLTSRETACSRERSRQALRLLDRDDLELLIAEGEAVVDCHFCHERYVFDVADLRGLLAELDAGTTLENSGKGA